MRWFIALLFLASPPAAQEDASGRFDYFVLSLSWSPNWCAIEGDARGSDQCEDRHDHGWILHGLWPQYERGFPDYCQTSARAPSRQMTREMADIMGTAGLAWHQWKKHGVCAGLQAQAYYDLSRKAFGLIKKPPALRRLTAPVQIAPWVIESAFIQFNPSLKPDQITITCREGHIQEARICLSKDLVPRRCGGDVIKDCTAQTALFTPIR